MVMAMVAGTVMLLVMAMPKVMVTAMATATA
jgi:hypothetical protein